MARKFQVMAITMSVCLIASNLFETKIFTAGPLTLTGGVLIFPISYIINDCITEIYGFKNARFAILTAMAMNLLVVGFAQIVRILPPAPFWGEQHSFDYVFSADLRITSASMAAFLCGSLINAGIMDKMKAARRDGGGFGLRAIVSTLCGECIDSIVFFPIAFWTVGFKNMLIMMVTQIVLKTLYEILILPVTAYAVRRLRANP